MNKNREQLDNSLFNDFMGATNKADFINLNPGNYQILDGNDLGEYLKSTGYREINGKITSEIKFENIIFNCFLKNIKMDIQKIRFDNCIFNCDFDVLFNNNIDFSYCIFLSNFNKLLALNQQGNNRISICFSYIESIVIEPTLLEYISIYKSNIMNMYIDGIPLGRGYECLTRILLLGNHIAYFSFAFDDSNYQKFELTMQGNYYSLKKNFLRILNKKYRKLNKKISTFPLLNSPKSIYRRAFSKHIFHTSKHLLSCVRTADYSVAHKVFLKYNVLAYNPNNMLLQKALIFLSYGFLSPLTLRAYFR